MSEPSPLVGGPPSLALPPSDPGPVQVRAHESLQASHPGLALLRPSAMALPPLCPLAPRKGSWLADKVKRLMRPRREGGLHGGPRLWANGAGSTESLGGPPEMELSESREADGTGGSPVSLTPTLAPAHPLVSSSLCGLYAAR